MSEKDDALQDWIQRHGKGLSPEARRELEELHGQVEREPKEDLPSFRERFQARVRQVMKWVGIGAVGLATAGGIAYVGKQAVDALPGAVETAAEREVNERIELVKTAFGELQTAAGTLLLKLMDFLIALKDKASTWEGISGMAVSVWDGIWSDAAEYLASGNTSPDKTLEKMKQMVSGDPVLAAKMDDIFSAYADLNAKKEALDGVATKIQSFDDQDALEFFSDYKKEFWDEMRGKGKELAK